MGDAVRKRGARSRAARRAAALVTAGCLLAGCSAQESPTGERSDGGDARSATASSAPPTAQRSSPSASRIGPGPPELSPRPASLASQVEQVLATLRDPEARAVDVRRAGELHQLAVRRIATSPTAFRRNVLRRLEPGTAAVIRPAVRAAAELHGLTDPQRTLPRWRIVPAPPRSVLARHYLRAQRRTGVPWRYLAAIHLVETRMGRIRGTSTAGARGPMQFLPSTWDLYGAGGDIDDPRDATLAAARLLKANGAPRDMRRALWHYNPSEHYVRAVTAYARTLQKAPYLYRGYWHWRVLYRHVRGTYVLPVGYPEKRAVLLR